ncbi:MAG TPA: hypothetical protein VGN37_03855 [Actinocatenispora sp.]
MGSSLADGMGGCRWFGVWRGTREQAGVQGVDGAGGRQVAGGVAEGEGGGDEPGGVEEAA